MAIGKHDHEERLYRIWLGMRGRCRNPNHSEYPRYGGRGITVCPEWESYTVFKAWALDNGYDDKFTIDRIDNNRGYSPENCRWATVKEQSNNRRSNHLITYNGKTQTMTQWAEETGISREMIKNRLRKGWSVERALTVKDGKLEKIRKYEFNGDTHTLSEWSAILGIKLITLHARLEREHLSVAEAFTRPVSKARYITFGARTLSYSAWAKELGISNYYFKKLVDACGMTIEDIATLKPRHTAA